MAISKDYVAYLEDLFTVIPGTSVKRMFGGAGMFRHGLMFALSLEDGKIALKADDQTAPRFEAEGCSEWLYPRNGKMMKMSYWHAPEFLFDDDEALLEWGMEAFEAAVRADGKKPPSQRKLKP